MHWIDWVAVGLVVTLAFRGYRQGLIGQVATFLAVGLGVLEVSQRKAACQPLQARSAGCIFRNPPGGSAGRMIDELGLKGLQRGDIVLSANYREVSTAAALEGIARQPSAAGRIQTPMILGLALIESLVLFALVIAYLLQSKITLG